MISEEEQLKTKLFDGYRKDIRPVLNYTHTVTVTLSLGLSQITDLVRMFIIISY